jgi:hypothetical protein
MYYVKFETVINKFDHGPNYILNNYPHFRQADDHGRQPLRSHVQLPRSAGANVISFLLVTEAPGSIKS